jgi:hypothetical protein
MEYYDKKAIGGIIAEVTVAQVDALEVNNPDLRLRVLEKLMIGMDLEVVQTLIDKLKSWTKTNKEKQL